MDKKTCARCDSPRVTSGGYCRHHANEYQREWRTAHRDKVARDRAEKRRDDLEENRRKEREQKARYYAENPGKRTAYLRRRRAEDEAFRKRHAAADKRYSDSHKEKKSETHKKWKRANPAMVKANHQRRRARMASAAGSFTASEWKAICRKQKWRCASCGLKKKLTADHIVPLARGGTNFAYNIQGLCGACNSGKKHHISPGAQHSIFGKVT